MTFLVRSASRAFNWLRLFGKPKHSRNVKTARAALRKLAAFDHEGAIIAYLRKINPFVFEELVLCLIERDGALVVRGRSYSGDGGADGSFYWPGRGLCAIQAKRYAKSITPSHARDFKQLCLAKYKGGVFAHTGRTGELSLEALNAEGLFILSGSGLTRAIKGANTLAMIEARSRGLQNKRPRA